jgi:hypothetical protein
MLFLLAAVVGLVLGTVTRWSYIKGKFAEARTTYHETYQAKRDKNWRRLGRHVPPR